MDKATAMWVLIRAFGFVCLWKMLEIFPSVFLAAKAIWELPEQSILLRETAMELSARSLANQGLWLLGMQFAIYLTLAAYCLFRGNSLHGILMNESRSRGRNW